MSNREMINHIRSELNQKRYLVLFLNDLKNWMLSSADKSLIERQMNEKMREVEELQDDLDFYIQKDLEENGI